MLRMVRRRNTLRVLPWGHDLFVKLDGLAHILEESVNMAALRCRPVERLVIADYAKRRPCFNRQFNINPFELIQQGIELITLILRTIRIRSSNTGEQTQQQANNSQGATHKGWSSCGGAGRD